MTTCSMRTVINLANNSALYSFLSTFSGTALDNSANPDRPNSVSNSEKDRWVSGGSIFCHRVLPSLARQASECLLRLGN
jgi:hypothetical protein